MKPTKKTPMTYESIKAALEAFGYAPGRWNNARYPSSILSNIRHGQIEKVQTIKKRRRAEALIKSSRVDASKCIGRLMQLNEQQLQEFIKRAESTWPEGKIIPISFGQICSKTGIVAINLKTLAAAGLLKCVKLPGNIRGSYANVATFAQEIRNPKVREFLMKQVEGKGSASQKMRAELIDKVVANANAIK